MFQRRRGAAESRAALAQVESEVSVLQGIERREWPLKPLRGLSP
jgi:hypothetical protein